jgi:diguanylate cyclase (GGDEF)-like protein
MYHLSGPIKRRSETRRYRGLLYVCQGMLALLLAGLLVPTPGMIATAAIAAAGLVLVGVQHFISRGLGTRTAELVGKQEALLTDADASRNRTEELFAMTDILQSAEDHADAGAVLKATSLRLLPNESGALYVFNNSRDRLDLAVSWSPPHSTPGDFDPPEALVPQNCWALKRGKMHINDPSAGTLCCSHHLGSQATLEVPMIARGTVYGLLLVASNADDRAANVKEVARIARALADTMSLALSNIALREKLRTQSLRDPLTGLYNRRYMEDALDRYLSMAERSNDSTSVIMIDLDHFKTLNDEHGHAKGDAVLRDVAVQLVGALRPADVVARYGGEELLVILPACPLEDAVLKAEILRGRIESLSELHGCAVSASFGVASVPHTSDGSADLIPMADAALYKAKQAGRNCVRSAEARPLPRGGGAGNGPRLAVG